MKVVHNYLYNAGYQLLLVILPLITATYTSRVLTNTGIGINAYTNSIISYFVLFGSIGVNLYGNRQIAYLRDNKEEMSQAFWEIVLLRTFTVVLTFIAFLIYMPISKFPVLMLFQSINLVAVILDISWLYMGLEDFKKTVTRNTAVKILSFLAIVLFVKDKQDLGLYIIILGLGSFLGNMTLWPFLRGIVKKVRIRDLHPFRHLRPSVALFIPQVAINVYAVLNKTMLGKITGDTVFSGYYNNADTIIKTVLALATATGMVMLPHVSNAFAKGDNKGVNKMLYESFDFVSFLSIAMMFGLAGLALHLGPYFYGPGFEPVGKAMLYETPVIMLIGWSNAIGQQYLLPTNHNKEYTISVTIGAIVNIIINVPLIYFKSLNGAIVATVISEACVTGYQLWVIRKNVNYKKLFFNVPKYLLAGFVMFLPVFKLNITLHTSIISIFAEVLLGMIIYVVMILILRPTIVKKGKELLASIRKK